MTAFTEFNLHPTILRALDEIGFAKPTPVQAAAIPVAMTGADLVATAQTGTGKTAAYLLPMLNRLKPERKPLIEALVLSPTRELALQIGKNLQTLSRYSGHRHTVIYGGSSVKEGRDRIISGIQIAVATPGRLLDYMGQGVVDLRHLKILALDEADRMLDMGFIPDVRRILKKTPDSRQTLLFSATFPKPIADLAKEFLRNPQRIEIGPTTAPAEGITQKVFPCAPQKKVELLIKLLQDYHWDSALVFTRTKRQADFVLARLKNLNFPVGIIHGDRTQKQRLQALEDFKRGRIGILVATNIAARGLDISGITHVVNFDTPDITDDYIHRIGRTARYDATGFAFTLVSPEEYADFLEIEKALGYKPEREEVEGFSVDIESRYKHLMGSEEKSTPVYFGFTGDAKPQPASEESEKETGDSAPANTAQSFGRSMNRRKRRI